MPPHPRPEPPRPEGMAVYEEGDTVSASWRWYTWQALVTLVFSLAGLWFVATHGSDARHGPAGALVLRALLALTCAGVAYTGLARLLNRTTFTVTPEVVTVTNGPLPWRGGGTWSTLGWERVSVEKTGLESEESARYQLVVDRRGYQLRVGPAVPEAARARWLGWLLETRLRLSSEPPA